jgi:hypothetical protein
VVASSYHRRKGGPASDRDEGFGIAVDGSGNAYVTGETFSADFPTLNAFQSHLAGKGTSDAFVTKIDPPPVSAVAQPAGDTSRASVVAPRRGRNATGSAMVVDVLFTERSWLGLILAYDIAGVIS